ncbi:MAG: endonuclease MutS2, partial [Lachnospiraceae bacterium]|nr:endonuclease MutS2 [Lachnospiraceae bacterium]
MNKKSLQTLEFNKITQMLADRTSTELGRKKALSLVPADSLFDIDLWQQNTEDALKRILRDGNISFTARRNMYESVSLLKKGSSLSAHDLLEIALLLENVLRVKSYGTGDDESI